MSVLEVKMIDMGRQFIFKQNYGEIVSCFLRSKRVDQWQFFILPVTVVYLK